MPRPASSSKALCDRVDLLDEHVVAELPRDAPDFEERFLEAMATARQRQSLFEAEEG